MSVKIKLLDFQEINYRLQEAVHSLKSIDDVDATTIYIQNKIRERIESLYTEQPLDTDFVIKQNRLCGMMEYPIAAKYLSIKQNLDGVFSHKSHITFSKNQYNELKSLCYDTLKTYKVKKSEELETVKKAFNNIEKSCTITEAELVDVEETAPPPAYNPNWNGDEVEKKCYKNKSIFSNIFSYF